MFLSRTLLESERAFARRFFAHTLDALLPRMRLYVRRVGDTRRALSLNGGRISMPRACFEHSDPRQGLRLSHPYIAGVFAHELLHQWQRLQGHAVTRQAAWLQVKAVCLGTDPYAYAGCDDQAEALQSFLSAQVEQQGQMWQDYVSGCIAGHADPVFAGVSEWVAGQMPETAITRV